MQYFVYLMASRKNGTLYVGVTNNLVRRAYEHKNGLVEGFTDRYGVHQLVWFESTSSVEAGVENCSDREGKPGVVGPVRIDPLANMDAGSSPQ